MSARIVLLAGRGESSHIVYNALRKRFDIAAVVLEDPVPRLEFLNRRRKRLGLRRTIGQFWFRALAIPYLRASSHSRIQKILNERGLDNSRILANAITGVPSVNCEKTVRLLRETKPDVVVVSGTRIISAEVLNSAKVPFINLHAGITPLYRGVHGAYWALVERDRPCCGVTVHLVDAGIDTGKILGQALIAPLPHDNFVTYPYLQLAAGIPVLCRAIEDAAARKFEFLPTPEGKSRLWTHPTLAEYVILRVKAGVK